MARMVATKAALSIRVDALADPDDKALTESASIGIAHRAKLESRLRALEYEGDASGVRRFAENGRKTQKFELTGDTKTYNTKADAVDLVSTQREDPMEIAVKVVLDVKEEKRRAKEEKRAKRRAEKEKAKDEGDSDAMDVDGEEKKSKKDKKRKRESEGVAPKDEPKDKVILEIPTFWRPTDLPLRVKLRRNDRHGKRRGRQKKLRRLLQLRMEILYRRKRDGSLTQSSCLLCNVHF